MKTIVALALAIAVATAFEVTGEEGLIKFNLNSGEESPIGFAMRGHLDPKDELNNKIETFLKLANTYIPILESTKNENNKLSWVSNWFNINLGPFGSISGMGAFELVVGWRVFLNSNDVNMTSNYLDVTYSPFAWGWTNASAIFTPGTSRFALLTGSYNATLWYVRAYVPISLNIHSDGKVCYSAFGQIWPIQLESSMNIRLQECKAEIIYDVIEGLPITLGCSWSDPCQQSHLNMTFTQNSTFWQGGSHCFNA